jgi:hypothetical protein
VYEPLLFSGVRWPAARVVERGTFPDSESGFVFGGKLHWLNALKVDTGGNGSAYEVVHAEGWWRDVADLSIRDERRVVSFLRRRGDPFGQLQPGMPIVTSRWALFIAVLRTAASAWEPSGQDGISPIYPREECASAENFHADFTSRDWESQFTVEYRGLTPVQRARSLAAYCIAAAATSLRQRLPMARCGYCSSWFTVHRTGAQFCSPSCRAAVFNKRSSPHGPRPQDHDSQGDASLAVPVAHAGTGREVSRAVTKFRESKGSKSPRRAHGRDRKTRRRRPAQA